MDSQDMNVVTRSKVVIIGAGPAGLVSARHLKEIADVQVFECKEDVGGLWNYTDLNEFNHPDIRSDMFYNLYGCLHGSLYKDLITNNPKHAMTFKDFCISKDYPNLMTNKQYLLYLRQYAEHFKLYDNIKFKTAVKGVKVDETEDHKFKITTVPANTNEGIEETISYCDFVLVCNGNQSVPVMPNYEGESEFEGKLFHIHSLRDITKEDFDDKRILIVGGAVSGCDIAAVLLCYKNEEVNPKKIKLVVRSEYSKFIDKSFSEQVANNQIEFTSNNVSRITKTGVIYEDGSEENFDMIIYTTGYKFSYPFLDQNDNIISFDEKIDHGNYFGPLYRKMFAINNPNVIFIGLIERTVILILTLERQAQLAKQYVSGMLTLPSKEDMLASLQEEHDINNKTTPPLSRFFHLSNLEGYSYLDYHRDLSKLTNLPINEVHYNEVKRLDGETGRLIKQGKACEIKFIDWGSVMGDYDYHTTSDKF